MTKCVISIFEEKSEIKPKTLHVLGHKSVTEQVPTPSSGLLYNLHQRPNFRWGLGLMQGTTKHRL